MLIAMRPISARHAQNATAACEIAGVEPDFVTFDDEDATGYALAVNINRRHLSKGQRAMAVAKVFPEPNTSGKKTTPSIFEGVHQGTLSQARTVLRLAPGLADDVLAGDLSLTDAHHKAGLLDGGVKADRRRMNELRARGFMARGSSPDQQWRSGSRGFRSGDEARAER
jgi:hypothetical protein